MVYMNMSFKFSFDLINKEHFGKVYDLSISLAHSKYERPSHHIAFQSLFDSFWMWFITFDTDSDEHELKSIGSSTVISVFPSHCDCTEL